MLRHLPEMTCLRILPVHILHRVCPVIVVIGVLAPLILILPTRLAHAVVIVEGWVTWVVISRIRHA